MSKMSTSGSIILIIVIHTLWITSIDSMEIIKELPEKACTIVDNRDIVCNAHNSSTFDLRTEFDKLSSSELSQWHFQNLFIDQFPLTEIGGNVFHNITFNSVHVYSAGALKHIDQNAFVWPAHCNQLNHQIYINSPSQLPAINALQMIYSSYRLIQAEVALSNQTSHKLIFPVTNQPINMTNQLKYLTLKPNDFTISLVDNYSFDSFPNLEVVKLANIPIKQINKNAFNQQSSETNQSLIINLYNCEIGNAVFQSEIKVNSRRTTILMLDNNPISLLTESIFKSFLDEVPNNKLSLYNNNIDCDNWTEHWWLWTQKQRYRSQIWGAKCSTGESLFDIEPYSGRCSYDTALNSMECHNILDKDFDILKELTYMQQILNISLHSVRMLTIDNCNLQKIQGNAFKGTNIEKIYLTDLQNLTLLDSNSLVDIADYMKVFEIKGTNRLTFDETFVKLLSGLSLVESLTLSFGERISIETKSFSKLKNLKSLRIDSAKHEILTTGSCVIFCFKQLKHLSLANNKIYEIPYDAFRTDFSVYSLNLDMQNCSIDESKFHNKPFDDTYRPLLLNLSNNLVEILDESKFRFLLKNSEHRIDLKGNPIRCQYPTKVYASSHPLYWIQQNIKLLSTQILNANCWDTNQPLFEYLEAYFNHSSSLQSNRKFFMMIVAIFTFAIVSMT